MVTTTGHSSSSTGVHVTIVVAKPQPICNFVTTTTTTTFIRSIVRKRRSQPAKDRSRQPRQSHHATHPSCSEVVLVISPPASALKTSVSSTFRNMRLPTFMRFSSFSPCHHNHNHNKRRQRGRYARGKKKKLSTGKIRSLTKQFVGRKRRFYVGITRKCWLETGL